MNAEDEYNRKLSPCLLIPACTAVAGIIYTIAKGNDVIICAVVLPLFDFFILVPAFVPISVVSALLVYVSYRTGRLRYFALANLIVSIYWFWLVVKCNEIGHIGISPFM